MLEGAIAVVNQLPHDLRAVLDSYAERDEWVGAITLLLTEGERRLDLDERVGCYLTAAAIYEQKFANTAEAQGILEYVLGLAPDQPQATRKLGEIYARARRKDRLRWLAENRQKLAAQAPVPRPLGSRVAAAAGSTGSAGGMPARMAAALSFVALPASVIAANRHALTLAEPHDNAGGAFGWLPFATLDLGFCTLFVAIAWLPGRWALRRVGKSTLLMKLALLGATFLIAMVPALGWNAIDAANVLLDPNPPSLVKVRVIAHEQQGKSRRRFPIVREHSASAGSTELVWSLGLEPIGSEHLLRRGGGFFGRAYYLRPQTGVR